MSETAPAPMAFIDLVAQRERLGSRIDDAVLSVINSGAFIMGKQVGELEKALALFGQSSHCLSCANGTDAIALPLMAWGIGAGDAVFCPSFTFVATAEVVPWVGATPVFVDVDPVTYNMDPASLREAIKMVLADGKLVPKVVIAVDLFGQPADYPAISAIAQEFGLKLIADSAQGFGCTLNGHHPAHWADCATTSFFPAKPLGAYGDGGAVLMEDFALWEVMDSLRVHGKATASDIARSRFEHDPKYLNIRVGINSRLDTIQAAILLEKLRVFPDEIAARNRVADRYAQRLGQMVGVPRVIDGGISTWAQYTIEVPERDAFVDHARRQGIPTAVYYPRPIHTQAIYADHPVAPGGLPVTEGKAQVVVSLPMHPDLDEARQDRVCAAVESFVMAGG